MNPPENPDGRNSKRGRFSAGKHADITLRLRGIIGKMGPDDIGIATVTSKNLGISETSTLLSYLSKEPEVGTIRSGNQVFFHRKPLPTTFRLQRGGTLGNIIRITLPGTIVSVKPGSSLGTVFGPFGSIPPDNRTIFVQVSN